MQLATEAWEYERLPGLRGREMSVAEIAAELRLSVRQVEQIKERAMRKLRRSPEARLLLSFVDFELDDAPRPVSFYTREVGARSKLLHALIDEREGQV